MKITKDKLKQIIKEEMNEMYDMRMFDYDKASDADKAHYDRTELNTSLYGRARVLLNNELPRAMESLVNGDAQAAAEILQSIMDKLEIQAY
jgi:hypothetical protein|tara:strand:+ start:937 stop:1209 length:273 start_codon:yes stop_codon:yes gene_type:complete